MPLYSSTVPAVLSAVSPPAPVPQQTAYRAICAHNYIATPAAIAAVRPSERHELLVPEADGAISAVPCFNINYSLIKHLTASSTSSN
jgi:hypothetical protein